MTDIREKAIEAAARTMCPPGIADDWSEISPEGKGLKRFWQMYVPGVEKVIAAYEAAMWQTEGLPPKDGTPVLAAVLDWFNDHKIRVAIISSTGQNAQWVERSFEEQTYDDSDVLGWRPLPEPLKVKP